MSADQDVSVSPACRFEALRQRAAGANAQLSNPGTSFTVYSDARTIDAILPFDVIARALSGKAWQHLESGIVQRITAINLLLDNIYHKQHLSRGAAVPALTPGEPQLSSPDARDRPAAQDVRQYLTDVVRDEHGDFFVVEDNARTPSEGKLCR